MCSGQGLKWNRSSSWGPLVHKLPLLVIATYRDDEAPSLPDDLPGTNLIRLNRLGSDDTGKQTNIRLYRKQKGLKSEGVGEAKIG